MSTQQLAAALHRVETVLQRRPDRPEFVRVRLRQEGGVFRATPAGRHQGSGNLLTMAEAHGFLLVDAETTVVSGTVPVQVFDFSFLAGAEPAYPWA